MCLINTQGALKHFEQCTATSCIKYLLQQPCADLSCLAFQPSHSFTGTFIDLRFHMLYKHTYGTVTINMLKEYKK